LLCVALRLTVIPPSRVPCGAEAPTEYSGQGPSRYKRFRVSWNGPPSAGCFGASHEPVVIASGGRIPFGALDGARCAGGGSINYPHSSGGASQSSREIAMLGFCTSTASESAHFSRFSPLYHHRSILSQCPTWMALRSAGHGPVHDDNNRTGCWHQCGVGAPASGLTPQFTTAPNIRRQSRTRRRNRVQHGSSSHIPIRASDSA